MFCCFLCCEHLRSFLKLKILISRLEDMLSRSIPLIFLNTFKAKLNLRPVELFFPLSYKQMFWHSKAYKPHYWRYEWLMRNIPTATRWIALGNLTHFFLRETFTRTIAQISNEIRCRTFNCFIRWMGFPFPLCVEIISKYLHVNMQIRS